jgi:hypothetical protein
VFLFLLFKVMCGFVGGIYYCCEWNFVKDFTARAFSVHTALWFQTPTSAKFMLAHGTSGPATRMQYKQLLNLLLLAASIDSTSPT